MASAVHPGPSDSLGGGHPSLTPGPVFFDDQTSHEAEDGQGTRMENAPSCVLASHGGATLADRLLPVTSNVKQFSS
jgi:hypothetical protein